MIILTIRTDKPEAEIGLYEKKQQLVYQTWQAHRYLAESLHQKIADLLNSKNLEYKNVNGIIVYKGPGSFTGLRIGLSVANALAYGMGVPIIGRNGEDWIEKGVESLLKKDDSAWVMPEYGAEPNITKPTR